MVVCDWCLTYSFHADGTGGVRELLDGSLPGSGTSAYLSFVTTIFGGGLLAGCVALVMKRLQ